MIFFLALVLSALLAYTTVPLAAWVGSRLGIVDQPGGRRRHQGVIPRTGGIALFLGFFLPVAFLLVAPYTLPAEWLTWLPPRNDPNEMRRLAALLAGSLFCVVAGFIDDRYELSSGPQYLVQFVAALIAIAGLIFIKHVNDPFGDGLLFGPDGFPWWIVWPLTIFWFMGMMNTVNWLDGLSGLVAGVTAIMCAVLALHMIFVAEPPQLSVALLPLALLGATLGFLPYNFAPARIFMGSSGSYLLGFAVAALGIMGGARVATVMLVLGLPALDVAWLIFDRWRRGVSPGQGGRDHLHLRLADLGVREQTIVIGYWGFCAAFGAITLLLNGQTQKIVALIVLGLLALAVLVWVGRGKKR
ncbi:MAG: undecaprenyl/decaprenyl-phosphate alpha-N-acetylglucosaminyl 1-phosphate transferase [Chloroflexi bacterium]|nr:MAG: undecaprenyl/decaprenyl-phosphate alpha-N-acetylglucosaminyl 1-phosphate transferase [Chloroflexota bacterium]